MSKATKKSLSTASPEERGAFAANDAEAARFVTPPPDGVVLSHRLLSPWHSNRVVFAVGHHREPYADTRVVNLDEMTLQCSGVGIYTGTHPVSRFPELAEGMKLAINRALTLYELGEVDIEVGRVINRLRFFAGHLVQNGIYRFCDCPLATIERFVDDLCVRPWHRVARLNRLLLPIARNARADAALAQSLVASNSLQARINVRRLSDLVGVFVPAKDVPNWFRRAIAKAAGDRPPSDVESSQAIPNRTYLKGTMGAINLLAFPPSDLDGLPYRPYPNVDALLKDRFPEGGSQTSNISPKQHAALFSTLLDWTFDYSPHVLSLIKIVRRHIEDGNPDGALTEVINVHSQLVDSGKMPPPKLRQLHHTSSKDSLQWLVRVAITAAGNLVALNHARRAKEVFGEGKPYGLYFGCLESHPTIPHNYVVDVYLQKGPQDYQKLPANSLVAKAVEFLENIHNLTRDLGTPELKPVGTTTAARRMHLCTMRNFTFEGFKAPRYYIVQRNYLPVILEASGIPAESWNEQQTPLRRAWLTLFMRRYDLPEWPGGQRALGQLDINSTISYQSDKAPRAIGGTVAELHGREALTQDAAAMLDSLAAAKQEYMLEGVQRLFSGTFTGGKFSAVVLKVAKTLSEKADFKKLSLERKAGKVAEMLSKRGFEAEPMSHIVCMAGSAAETRSSAKCNIDGSLHREDASPETCNGCINGWSNDSYVKAITDERDRCRDAAANSTLSPAERKSFEAAAFQLSNVIDAQVSTAKEMRDSIESLVASWNQQDNSEAAK